MAQLLEFGQRYGWGVVLLVFVAWVCYKERDRLFSLFVSHQQRVEEKAKGNRAFEKRARERLLENGEYSRELVQRILSIYEAERIERRSVSQQLLQAGAAAERVSVQAIEVMRDFVNIARMQADRQTEIVQELVPILEETRKCLSAVWFVLVKLHGISGDEVESLLSETEVEDDNVG